jgi:hypothetical protein
MLYPPLEGSTAGNIIREKDHARVCLFIKKALNPGAWSHTAYSRDCQELQLRYNTPDGEQTLRLFNIYNQPEQHQLSAVARLTNLLTGKGDELVIGDFNLHHPMWGGPDTAIDNAADDLIDDMEER